MVVVINRETKTKHNVIIGPYEGMYKASCDNPNFEVFGPTRDAVYKEALVQIKERLNPINKTISVGEATKIVEPEINFNIRSVVINDIIYNITYEQLDNEVEAKTTRNPKLTVRAPTKEEAYNKIKLTLENTLIK